MSDLVRPLRTVLYMPGSNARAIDKARNLDCDGIILDLEDAVAPEAKAEARTLIAAALKEGGFGHRFLILRINSADTQWYADDIAMANTINADAFLIPKINNHEDIQTAANALPGKPLWAMMETPLAMLNAQRIASDGAANGHLKGFVLGTNDLSKDTGAALVPGRLPMLSWFSTCVAAARAYGLTILDGVFNHLDDPAGFEAECYQARDLGMHGKTVIHPKQVDVCNTVFAPSVEDVAFARTVIEAFELEENQGKGALRVAGKMVETLHADMARRTVAMADAIAARKTAP
ncbi:MAG: CoA ester lyase [Pseudomonadota bacterium]